MSEFSLIIPCYNEADNLPSLIKKCINLTENREMEVVLVDNGSTDNSLAVLEQQLHTQDKIRFVSVKENKGYGHGILAGLNAAKGEILAWTHADMQTDPNDCAIGLKYFETDKENTFVKGKRYGRPFADVFFTFGMSIFETLLLRTPLFDINAQPTMFHRNFFMQWQDPPNDFSLDLFAYYLAKRKKMNINRFPVIFSKRLHGQSHWNINFSAKVKFIKRTISYSFELKRRLKNGNHRT